ncbi:hypothetical protein AAHE18_04G149500 [Arachis hypogaea]
MGTELISIINTKYCKPAPINIKIETDKGVAYINNEVIFRIHEPSFSLEDRRVIYDVSGNPVFTLSKKIISMHDRWRVFKGQSTNSSDLLFSAKRSTFLIPEKKNIDLNVYLAKNTKESVWDFKVCAGAEKRSCDICAHGSSTLLAKLRHRHPWSQPHQWQLEPTLLRKPPLQPQLYYDYYDQTLNDLSRQPSLAVP